MGQKKRRKIPLGESNFKYIIEKDFYYIDKTLFIHNIIQSDSKILLFPRPRRFGKTINISMLRYFFEKSDDSNANLFNRLAIKNLPAWKYQGKYPVINLSLRNCHGRQWQSFFTNFTHEISSEYHRHAYLLGSDVLDKHEKVDFESIIWRKVAIP